MASVSRLLWRTTPTWAMDQMSWADWKWLDQWIDWLKPLARWTRSICCWYWHGSRKCHCHLKTKHLMQLFGWKLWRTKDIIICPKVKPLNFVSHVHFRLKYALERGTSHVLCNAVVLTARPLMSPGCHTVWHNRSCVSAWWFIHPEVRYSANHNILRTVGFLAVLAAVGYSVENTMLAK